jgi:hypothetical protein
LGERASGSFRKQVLRKIFRPKREEVITDKLKSCNIKGLMKENETGYIAHNVNKKCIQSFVPKYQGKGSHERPTLKT